MIRSFEIGKKVIKYDLNYFFSNSEILDDFMKMLDDFCHSELKNSIENIRKNEIGVSEILEIINSKKYLVECFIKQADEKLLKVGRLAYFTFLILGCKKLARLRQYLMKFIISHFTVLYQSYDYSVFELIGQEYQKIKIPAKEKNEIRKVFSATVDRVVKAENEARKMFTDLFDISGEKLDKFYEEEFDFEKASIAELRQNWLLFGYHEWFNCSESDLENLNKKFSRKDRIVRSIIKEAISSGYFSTVKAQHCRGQNQKAFAYDYILKMSLWLEENGVIGDRYEDRTRKILVSSLKEFDKKFR